MKKIRRGIGKKVNYFTKDHENDIVLYNTSESMHERHVLYRDSIQPVFSKLVEKVVIAYKFHQLSNIDVLKAECKSHLIENIRKFQPAKGKKAFSYFTTISRNFFFLASKKQKDKLRKEIQFENVSQRMLEKESRLVTHNPYIEKEEEFQFWIALKDEMELWSDTPLRDNERRVLDAVFEVLEKKESLEILNKRAIYMHLRTLTGMNTKQIVSNLDKFRVKYKSFRNEWDNGNI